MHTFYCMLNAQSSAHVILSAGFGVGIAVNCAFYPKTTDNDFFYGVATFSRIDNVIGLFCRILSLL